MQHRRALPFRDAFAVLFFVSVGMLFNPTILLTHPWQVLGTLFIILVGKSAIGFFLVIALKRPIGSALTISASLAQIGEFSFILAALGVGLGLLPPEAQSYILAGSIISIIVNPLLMFAAEHLRPQLEARIAASAPIVVPQRVEPDVTATAPALPPPVEAIDERTPTALAHHAVLIGYGRVGTVVADGLKRQGTPFVLIEDSEKRVAAAHAAGIEVVIGNAAGGKALALANIAAARTLLIAIPNAFEAGQAVEQAHKLNPSLQIIARAHSDEEVTYLHDLGAQEVIMGEREIGLGMLGWTNGESQREVSAERTQAGMNAIAAALDLSPAAPAGASVPTPPPLPPEPVIVPEEPAAPPEVLEAAIEAAHPEHIIEGPAEPFAAVPALGEMPVEDAAVAEPVAEEPVPAIETVAAIQPVEPVSVVPTVEPPVPVSALQPQSAPEPVVEPTPPRPKPSAPASTPGAAFNPEVEPVED